MIRCRTPFIVAVMLAATFGGAVGPLRAQTRPAGAASAPSLADAVAAIRSRPKVDLTHAFGPSAPMRAGFGQPRMTPAVDPHTLEPFTIARDGFRATYYALAGSTGTHVIPPAQAAPDGATLDELSLDEMVLPLVVLDDTPFLAADPVHAFAPEDLAGWEAAHGRVPAGSFVALRTGMAKDWATDPGRFKRDSFPGWSLAVLKILVEERGVVAIGHESLAPDATPSGEAEAYVLGRGRWQIAAMDNLDRVPALGAVLFASWAKPTRGLSFPARAWAVLP